MVFSEFEPRFPAVLPQPLQAGYKIESVDASRSFETDSGITRRRSVYRSAPRKATVTWKLNQAQLDALDEFFEVALEGGALAFAIDLYGVGPGLRTAHAKFTEPYQVSVIDIGLYSVSANLWILRSVAFEGRNIIGPAVQDTTNVGWDGADSYTTTAP